MPVFVSLAPKAASLPSPRSWGRDPAPALPGWDDPAEPAAAAVGRGGLCHPGDHRDGRSCGSAGHLGHPPCAFMVAVLHTALQSIQPWFAWGAAMRRGGGDGVRRGCPRLAGSRRWHLAWRGRRQDVAWALASGSAPAAVPRQHCGAERWSQPLPQQPSVPCQSALERHTPACNVTGSLCLSAMLFFC